MSAKRIFLGNSPWLRPGEYGVRAGSRWPHFEKNGTPYMPFPFFLAHATSLLKQHDFDALVVDGVAERISASQFFDKLKQYQPDIVVLEVSSASMDVDLEMLNWIRKEYGRDFPIIWCGALSWQDEKDNILRQVSELDMFIRGEYEHVLLQLCEQIDGGTSDLSTVAGLIWRDSQGEIHTNPNRELVKNLDEFPWPERDQLPMHNYMEAAGSLPWPNLQMWASRGCPFRCNFCVWPQFMYAGRNYRTRSAADILDEVEFAIARHGLKSVYFDDDTFNIGKKRINEISDEFKKRKLGIPWGAMSRADTFDRPTFENMVESGFKFIKFGVESGVQSIVDRMDKALKLDKVRDSMQWSKELGVKTHLTFSFGHIGETAETAQQTIDFALELDPDSIQFSIITPFPGSDLYKDLKEAGQIATDDLSKYDGYTSAVISTESLSAEALEAFHREANTKWQRHVLWRTIKRADLNMFAWSIKNPKRALQRIKEVIG